MQYWINYRGVQSGPVDIDGLKEMGLTSAAYVWHEGLTDWVKITQLPELQGLYEMEDAAAAPQQQVAEPQATASEAVEGQPYQPQQPQQPYTQQQPQQYQPLQTDQAEPCPPTNLVWAILACVFCCIPFGIVGIIYANKVTKCYLAGDIMGAKKASDTSAWWVIASVVVGVVWRPLMTCLMGAG